MPSPRAAASIHCFGGPSEDARFCSAAVSINVREGRYDGPGVFGVVSGPEELPEISFNLVSEIEGVDGRRVTPNDPNVRDFRVQALHVRVELRNDRFDGPLVVPNREVVLVVNHSSERHDFTMRGEDLVLEPEESFRAEFAIPIIADGNWGWHVQTWFYPN